MNPPPPTETTDEALFEGYRQGDEKMLENLIHRYEGPLYGFLTKTTGNPAAAAELFQDTWVRVVRKGATYQSGRPFRAWLYQVALNLARDRFRQAGRAPVPLNEEAESVGGGETPAAALDRQERAAAVAAAIAELPGGQRQVFLLRHDGELPLEEIAGIVGRPLNTVKSDLRRALQKLRQRLLGREEGR